jgi:hypothetical protein
MAKRKTKHTGCSNNRGNKKLDHQGKDRPHSIALRRNLSQSVEETPYPGFTL